MCSNFTLTGANMQYLEQQQLDRGSNFLFRNSVLDEFMCGLQSEMAFTTFASFEKNLMKRQ
jgi:hypothetical protein